MVLDQKGRRIKGAQVKVYWHGSPVGALITSGESTIGFEAGYSIDGLELEVSMGEQRELVAFTSFEEQYEFVFEAQPLLKRLFSFFLRPGATCPDGTSGQPCVTCQFDRYQIRLCA
jgi:hypothetical protein